MRSPRDRFLKIMKTLTKASRINNTIIPRLVQVVPFQKSKNDDDPSSDLVKSKIDIVDIGTGTYRPAAKMLLAFPLSTSTAVTGPGTSELEPIASQLVFENVYCAMFAAVLSDNAIEPAAMSCSMLF